MSQNYQSKHMTIRMPESWHAAIKAVSRQREMPVNRCLLEAIEGWLPAEVRAILPPPNPAHRPKDEDRVTQPTEKQIKKAVASLKG